MALQCPECDAEFGADDVNPATDVAHCTVCHSFHVLSQLLNTQGVLDGLAAQASQEDALVQPAGAWHRRTGRGTIIGASLRHKGNAIFFSCFTVFWNSITSIFVVMGLAALLNAMGLADFDITNDSGEQVGNGEAGFLLLFLIPFVLVGIATAVIALGAIWGKTEVAIDGHRGAVRTGVGPLRWTKKFDAGAVSKIRTKQSSTTVNSKPLRDIVMEAGPKTLKFGSLLSERRQAWLVAALKAELL